MADQPGRIIVSGGYAPLISHFRGVAMG
jgi:hypothetical protein